MKLHEIRHIDRPLHEVFAFTADFSNAERWDPGVAYSNAVADNRRRCRVEVRTDGLASTNSLQNSCRSRPRLFRLIGQ